MRDKRKFIGKRMVKYEQRIVRICTRDEIPFRDIVCCVLNSLTIYIYRGQGFTVNLRI